MYAGAEIPMVDFNICPDLKWLLGAQAIAANGDPYEIVQAAQQFRFRMDETDARAKVASAIGIHYTSAIRDEPMVFAVRNPFYCWWTQKGIDLPMAAAFVDWDSMKKPAGSLEEM
jgi:hypothetical protein